MWGQHTSMTHNYYATLRFKRNCRAALRLIPTTDTTCTGGQTPPQPGGIDRPQQRTPLTSRVRPPPLLQGGRKLANAPPFTLADIKNAIPARCFEKNTLRSAAYLALDVGIVAAMAFGAYQLDNPLVWPLYWFAQGTMFWALFVVGHDW